VEARPRELVVVFLVSLAALMAVPSPAGAQDGTASGRLTVNGEVFTLTHAYAAAHPGFFDKSKEDIRVLLSDIELTEEAQNDVFELTHLARDGKAHIIEVTIDAEQRPISGAIYVQPFNGMASVTGMHEFAPQSMERKRIAGRLSMDGPRTFMDVTYEYDATFSAAIPRPPTAEELAAALATPAAKTATAYVAAIVAGRAADVRALLTPGAAKAFDAAGPAQRLAELKADTPADSHVVGLTTPTPTTAVATVNGTRDGIAIEFNVPLRRTGERWQVEP
jgi:hypothetical protein